MLWQTVQKSSEISALMKLLTANIFNYYYEIEINCFNFFRSTFMKKLVIIVAMVSAFTAYQAQAIPITRLQDEIGQIDTDIQAHERMLKEAQGKLSNPATGAALRKEVTRDIQQYMSIIRQKEAKRKELVARYEEEIKALMHGRGQSKGG